MFLAGFAILPVRAVLYTFSDNSVWLIGVQLLDGVGAGIFGALTPLVIADLMRGTGRYNLALGAIATMQGIGASLSGLAAGVIVDHFGYSATFLTLGAAAGVALIVFALKCPKLLNQGRSPWVRGMDHSRKAWALGLCIRGERDGSNQRNSSQQWSGSLCVGLLSLSPPPS